MLESGRVENCVCRVTIQQMIQEARVAYIAENGDDGCLIVFELR